jgi:hypothetical protein
MPLPLLPATTFWIVPSHWSTFFVADAPVEGLVDRVALLQPVDRLKIL